MEGIIIAGTVVIFRVMVDSKITTLSAKFTFSTFSQRVSTMCIMRVWKQKIVPSKEKQINSPQLELGTMLRH